MVFGRRQQSDETLEQDYDRHLQDSMTAALQGLNTDAARHSAAALAVSRQLFAGSSDPARHRPVLASALYSHAGSLRRIGRDTEALDLLAEAGQHYESLAEADPARFQVRAIDVVVRMGLALRAIGDVAAAAQQFDAAIEAYRQAATADTVERDLGLARAHFHLGRCLLELSPGTGDGLEEIDAGLFVAERVRQEQGITAKDVSWLVLAPLSFQLIATDWIAAAVCAMELHDAAGRFDIAADAANIAVRVSAGLTATGGPGRAELYQAVLARAQTIWQRARNPVQAAAERAGPTQRVVVGGGAIQFATPEIETILRATGWANG
jgi:tetratricopeptide (TPR) repeat protein